MGKNQVFGGKCTVLSMSYSPERLLWRTLQLSMFEGLEQYLDRYPKSGTMRNGVLYELQISEHLIEERDGSVSLTLPTPIASDPDKHHSGGLHRLIVKGERYSKGDHRILPTPTVNGAQNSIYNISVWKRKSSLNAEAAKLMGLTMEIATTGTAFQLHPQFVEEMMGFPIGWTELNL